MKYIIIYITFTFTVIVNGCGNNAAINQAKVQTELDSTDYEIITKIFNDVSYKNFNDSIYEWSNPRIVLDSTEIAEPQDWLIDKHRTKYPNEDYLIKGLMNLNFNKKFKIDTANIPPINGLIVIEDKDIPFYVHRENKIGLGVGDELFQISRPYVDNINNRAIIFTVSSSFDWKDEKFIWLEKKGNTWEVYNKLSTERN